MLLVCLAVHVIEVVSSQTTHELNDHVSDIQVRIMSSNLLYKNADYESHLRFIKTVNPDVIAFQEYTYAWQSALLPELKDYVYRVEAPALHAFGNALFSKYPLNDAATPAYVNKERRSVEGTVNFEGATLRVFGTHPPPPLTKSFYADRNIHLQRLGDIVGTYTETLVILGDLNITPWSSDFQDFVETANVRDGRRGLGIYPTWPADNPLLRIPIDHILVSEGVRVLSMNTSTDLGSDHKAIWADISIVQ